MSTNAKSAGIFAIVGLLIAALVGVIILGFLKPSPQEVIQGEVEVSQYRVSSKVPSRVLEIRVDEGDYVKKGDTLAIMDSPEVEAKMTQAVSARTMAEAIEKKAENGARAQEVQGAYELWQKAKAGLEVSEKTYKRVERLFQNGVLPEQKRDEAKAQYEAMKATEKAARAQYEMAQEGARSEDKAAARAQVGRAQGAVDEVSSYRRETVLTASEDGQVAEIFPQVGELVGTGAPIMNIAITGKSWFTFNVREDKLPTLKVGGVHKVYVPALDKTIEVRISRIKNVGNFAAWKATRALDGVDLKVFEVKAVPQSNSEELIAGMSGVLDND